MRKHLRDYGFSFGELFTGEKNSIIDVPDVKVGHFTFKKNILDSEGITTGVTAILPHGGNLFYEKVPAASFVLNGFGKTTGLVQIEELGVIESPIMLTNTFSTPAVIEGTLKYMLEQNREIGEAAGTINIPVGECNDSFLNDIRGLHIRPEHAIEAIKRANSNIVVEGAVGAGTGMTCFGWKGGIGSSSRIINSKNNSYTIGTLVVSNFGIPDELIIKGYQIGNYLRPEDALKPNDGSIIIVVATDVPMNSRQLKRLAKRASLGLSRTGATAHNGSGDIIIAFSNGNKISNTNSDIINMNVVNEQNPIINKIFQGVIESVEESIINSLFMAETTYGRLGRKRDGIPIEKIVTILKKKL